MEVRGTASPRQGTGCQLGCGIQQDLLHLTNVLHVSVSFHISVMLTMEASPQRLSIVPSFFLPRQFDDRPANLLVRVNMSVGNVPDHTDGNLGSR